MKNLLIFAVVNLVFLFVFSSTQAQTPDRTLDPNCVQRLTIEGNLDLVDELCIIEGGEDFEFDVVSYNQCAQNGLDCVITRERCVELTRGDPPLAEYSCVDYVVEDFDTVTDTPDPNYFDELQFCRYEDPSAVDKVETECEKGTEGYTCNIENFDSYLNIINDTGQSFVPDGTSVFDPAADIRSPVAGVGPEFDSGVVFGCRAELSTVNFAGVNLGPPGIALAKIVRSGLTAFFAFVAIFFGFRLVYVFFQISQRNEEAYESAQKTMIDAVIGLILMAIGIVVIQVLSTLFGISGNIFEFSY